MKQILKVTKKEVALQLEGLANSNKGYSNFTANFLEYSQIKPHELISIIISSLNYNNNNEALEVCRTIEKNSELKNSIIFGVHKNNNQNFDFIFYPYDFFTKNANSNENCLHQHKINIIINPKEKSNFIDKKTKKKYFEILNLISNEFYKLSWTDIPYDKLKEDTLKFNFDYDYEKIIEL